MNELNLKPGHKRSREDEQKAIEEIASELLPGPKRAIANCPANFRLQYAKSLSSRQTPGSVIKLKCYECVGFSDVRNQIGGCNVRTCPLWFHRPFQDYKKNSGTEEADEVEDLEDGLETEPANPTAG